MVDAADYEMALHDARAEIARLRAEVAARDRVIEAAFKALDEAIVHGLYEGEAPVLVNKARALRAELGGEK